MKNVIKDRKKVNVSLTISKSSLEKIKELSSSYQKSANVLFEDAITEYLERQLIRKLVTSYTLHPVNQQASDRAWLEFDLEKELCQENE